jgi:hypothetical protein
MTYKIKKIIIFPFLLLITMNNCATSTASLLGPALTGIKSGNVYHSGISYTSSKIIKNQLGKNPTEFVTSFLIQKPITSKATNIKRNIKNIEYTKNYRDIDNEYSEFVIAVKKMLK